MLWEQKVVLVTSADEYLEASMKKSTVKRRRRDSTHALVQVVVALKRFRARTLVVQNFTVAHVSVPTYSISEVLSTFQKKQS